MISIPPLESYCNSWVVIRRTGEVVGEFHNRKFVGRFNPATCYVLTTAQYLEMVNRIIDAGKPVTADAFRLDS